jgi:hypothetical protein
MKQFKLETKLYIIHILCDSSQEVEVAFLGFVIQPYPFGAFSPKK